MFSLASASASTPVPAGFHASNSFLLIILVAAAVATVSALILLRWLFSGRSQQRKFPVSSAIVFALFATVVGVISFASFDTVYEGDVSVAAVSTAADGNWYILEDGGSVLSPVKVDVTGPTTLHFGGCRPETENGIVGILNCKTVTAATSER